MSRKRGRQPDRGVRSPPYSPASLRRRLAALLYDLILLTGVLFAATLVALLFRNGSAFGAGDGRFTAYLVAVSLLFYSGFWTHGGQTPGMRAWRIRLMTERGGDVGWGLATLRCALAMLSASLFGLGYLWAIIDPQRRSWHDWATRTRIVGVSQQPLRS